MRICYFGTYEEGYSRNQIIIKNLRKLGHTVTECHVSLWNGMTDKTGALSGWQKKIRFFAKLLTAYPRLFIKYLLSGRQDVIFVGYFGHLDMIAVALFNGILFRRKKIVFDVFLSLYDSMVNDRKMGAENSLLGKITQWLDTTSCRLADVVLLDTNQHIDFFHKAFGVPKQKMVRIFASADTDTFMPKELKKQDSTFNVLFMGKYIPLHGIEHIIDAAELLEYDTSTHFTFIGKGQLYPAMRKRAAEKKLKNISFIDWVEYEKLPDYIAAADVCLGIFAPTEKAARVIPNKVFQAMAMGKAVITGRTPGSSEGLVDGSNVLLCNTADPKDLARAIIKLKENVELRGRIGHQARDTFELLFGEKAIQSSLRNVLEEVRL